MLQQWLTCTYRNSSNINKLKYLKRKLSETNEKRQERLQKERDQQKCQKKLLIREKRDFKKGEMVKTNKYLKYLLIINKRPINVQFMNKNEHKKNIDLFHKSNEYSLRQSIICLKVLPLKSTPFKTNQYQCSRYMRDRQIPKKFWKENNVIPSSVPYQLQGLTQQEQMLVAGALPIMCVYIKPGGQRGYSCTSLYKSALQCRITSTFFTKTSKQLNCHTWKDVTVRRQTVCDALQCLIENNPYY